MTRAKARKLGLGVQGQSRLTRPMRVSYGAWRILWDAAVKASVIERRIVHPSEVLDRVLAGTVKL